MDAVEVPTSAVSTAEPGIDRGAVATTASGPETAVPVVAEAKQTTGPVAENPALESQIEDVHAQEPEITTDAVRARIVSLQEAAGTSPDRAEAGAVDPDVEFAADMGEYRPENPSRFFEEDFSPIRLQQKDPNGLPKSLGKDEKARYSVLVQSLAKKRGLDPNDPSIRREAFDMFYYRKAITRMATTDKETLARVQESGEFKQLYREQMEINEARVQNGKPKLGEEEMLIRTWARYQEWLDRVGRKKGLGGIVGMLKIFVGAILAGGIGAGGKTPQVLKPQAG